MLAESLVKSMPPQRILAQQGKPRIISVESVVRLRSIYLQQKADAYKESTVRLRDSIVFDDDYK